MGTSGQLLDGEVIGVGIPGTGGTHNTDSNELAIAVEVAEGHFKLLKGSDVLHVDGLDQLEGAVVGGVGHHAHLEDGAVAGARGAGPEFKHQRVDGIDVGIHSRQDSELVVAVGARRGGGIPIEAAGTRAGVGGGGIGVSEVLRAIVDMMPAGDDGAHGGGTRGEVLKAVGVGQAIKAQA